MKRKTVNIMAICFMVLLMIIVGFIFSKYQNNKPDNSKIQIINSSEPFSELIVCTTNEALKSSAEKNKAKIEYDSESLYISNVNGWGFDFNINGVGNIDGNFSRVEAYCYLKENDQSIDSENLSAIAKKIVNGFIEMFGIVDIKDCYYICDNNGNPLDISLPTSYESVLEGNATIKTSVKEDANSYWELYINSSQTVGPICNIVHYINDDEFIAIEGIITIND